jgi:hypothetical protein
MVSTDSTERHFEILALWQASECIWFICYRKIHYLNMHGLCWTLFITKSARFPMSFSIKYFCEFMSITNCSLIGRVDLSSFYVNGSRTDWVTGNFLKTLNQTIFGHTFSSEISFNSDILCLEVTGSDPLSKHKSERSSKHQITWS